jgi:hypothetical protein
MSMGFGDFLAVDSLMCVAQMSLTNHGMIFMFCFRRNVVSKKGATCFRFDGRQRLVRGASPYPFSLSTAASTLHPGEPDAETMAPKMPRPGITLPGIWSWITR